MTDTQNDGAHDTEVNGLGLMGVTVENEWIRWSEDESGFYQPTLGGWITDAQVAVRQLRTVLEDERRVNGTLRQERATLADALTSREEDLAFRTQRIDELTQQLDDTHRLATARAEERDALADSVGQLRTELADREQDLATIGFKLRDEAMRRDWCGEYGDFVDVVNNLTRGEWLRPCYVTESRTFLVTVDLTAEDQATVERALESALDQWRQIDVTNHASDVSVYVESYSR